MWRVVGGEARALRAELMKLSEDEPLQDLEKQIVVEKIIFELGQSEAAAIIREADKRVMLFTSLTADDEFFLLELYAEEAVDGLRAFAREISRCKREHSNQTSFV